MKLVVAEAVAKVTLLMSCEVSLLNRLLLHDTKDTASAQSVTLAIFLSSLNFRSPYFQNFTELDRLNI